MRVNPNSLLAVLVGFTLNLGLSGVAQADLPAATAYAGIPSVVGSGELMDTTWSWSDLNGYSVDAAATSGPLPSLAVTAHSGTTPGLPWYQPQPSLTITGYLNYAFQINGPNASTYVPIRASGAYRMDSFGSRSQVQVQAAIRTGNQVFDTFGKACGVAYNIACENGVFSLTTSLPSGFIGGIQLYTSVVVASALDPNTNTLISNVGSAYIDPYIEIDPTWALTHPGYSISVSPGVGNIASVPEAETYAMMLAGLGLVGFMARRRKQLEA